MKSLIIINENFVEMNLGRNTSLSYILACLELDHDVYIHNLNKKISTEKKIAVFHLKKEQKLITEYKKSNQEIADTVAQKNYQKLINLPKIQVADFLSQKPVLEEVSLDQFDIILQRLEPMNFPFPPHGKENFDENLRDLKTAFPNKIFNCPIGLGDKEIPQEINRILQENGEALIATPTAEFRLADENFSAAFAKMFFSYREIFPQKKNTKIVLKPKNSAQSCGVFALEISTDGMNLNNLQNKMAEELSQIQNYKILPNLAAEEFKKIIEILCYLQRLFSDSKLFEASKNKIISAIPRLEIQQLAQDLYNEEILVQPFLEGVKQGDIRVNLLKNSAQDFYIAGTTYRKSQRLDEENFTTSYARGGATSFPTTELTIDEQKDLQEKMAKLLKILNENLREKYHNSLELGVDFILIGDGKKMLLGEINHNCPALMPVSEALANDENYDGGLGLAKRAIGDLLTLQRSW